ncbi:hypothetical protein [Paenibacillus albus]|uniref:Uncharacterized protein n=1 Tax=Paenibacillus albus TaxID=2495582 RepID=A0A3S9A1A9_9BACL|nr:hypothetical protein [Paenibacillus albus]AZN39539.1 hypothetical protein EJC50_07585 [Paenibacillus albus]
MTKTLDLTHLFKKALELLKTDLSKAEFEHIEPSASWFLNEIHQRIRSWDESSSISIFEPYWLNKNANDVSAEGVAKMNKANFTVFVNDPTTQEKLKQLLMLRKNADLDYRLPAKISKVGLIEHLDRFNFSRGNKPVFFVHRMLIMIFPELFTSIADRVKLDESAKVLGIKSKGVAFELVQYQLRDKVNDFIIEAGLQNESEFVKRGIAWWVLDAAKALKG